MFCALLWAWKRLRSSKWGGLDIVVFEGCLSAYVSRNHMIYIGFSGLSGLRILILAYRFA